MSKSETTIVPTARGAASMECRKVSDASKTTTETHPDDLAVDRFAAMMKAKMAASRAKGRFGWQECPEYYLLALLDGHVEKGDMRDVANIAMMIHLNSEAAQ